MKRILLLIAALFISINLFANEKYFEGKYFFANTRLKLRENSNLSSKVITILDNEACVLLLEEGISATIDDIDDNLIQFSEYLGGFWNKVNRELMKKYPKR